MADLGFGGVCERCHETHLLAEVIFKTDTPFTGDSVHLLMCSRCLDEYVSNQIGRVADPVDMLGRPWPAIIKERREHDTMHYQLIDGSIVEATLYGWVQGHV